MYGLIFLLKGDWDNLIGGWIKVFYGLCVQNRE